MATPGGNNAQNSSAVARQGSNHADRLSIWLADLESIRRERPVVNPSLFPAQQVVSQSTHADPLTPGAGKAGSKVFVVESDGNDSDDDSNPLHTFYGQQGAPTAQAEEMIRYQNRRLALQNMYPSPQNGLGFDMDRLRSDKAWANPIRTLQDVQPAWDHAMFMSEPPYGFDEAVSRKWTSDSGTASLLFGFPLLSNVVFYRPMNYGGTRSACFFKALAYLVYGDQSLNQRVQAEHLQHFSDVLEWDDHPRHRLYMEMNQKFYNTTISTDNTNSRNSEVNTAANFYQLLSIPQAWMPLDMLDVTADIYNFFIVVFTITESTTRPLMVTEVNIKGSYNARHVFLLFNGFHYQPMVPNEFLASEFTFPRVTYENVCRENVWSRNTDQGKSSPDLRWRMTWGSRLDRRAGALPVDHVFYTESLRAAMTGDYWQR